MDFAHEFLERRRRLQMRVNRATLGFRFTPVYPSFAFGYQVRGSLVESYDNFCSTTAMIIFGESVDGAPVPVCSCVSLSATEKRKLTKDTVK